MDGSNKIICRLCLEITPACECVTIEQIRKEILEVLPKNLNFEISDYAVVCNKCLESLQHCFDFKSQCNTIYLDTDTKVDIKNVSQNEMVSNGNIYLENSQVCRLCMSVIRDKDLNYTTNLKDGGLLKDMIRNCLPALVLNSVHEPLICNQCLNSITRYYKFVKSCQQVELRIEHFCQAVGHDAASRVNLKDMLKFKHCDELGKPLIKKECSDAENVDVNVTECLKSEEIARIQCEEINIKDELDNGVEFSKFDQPEDYDSSGKSSKGEEKIKKSESNDKLHFCHKCPYSSNCSSKMTKHIRCHRDNEVRKCTLCSFVTDTRLLLRAHIIESHSGLTKTYGCRECPYETDQKHYLERHCLTHKDKWEVEVYQCAVCLFQSRYKSTVQRHRKMQHDKNVEIYKCNKCSYSCKQKTNLRRHQTVHENPEEIRKHKCETCGYLFKRSVDVKKHMVVHTGNRIFSCNKCSYSTTYKGDLRMHKQSTLECDHVMVEKTMLYYCATCNFETKYKSSLNDHVKRCLKRMKENDQKIV